MNIPTVNNSIDPSISTNTIPSNPGDTSDIKNDELYESKLVSKFEKHSALALKYKCKLIHERIKKLININLQKINICGGSFGTNNDHVWDIEYIHKTAKFKISDYLPDDEKMTSTTIKKETKINFGYNNGYYICGAQSYNIYMSDKIHIISNNYMSMPTLENHEHLIKKYMNNKDLPEWLALYVFNSLSPMFTAVDFKNMIKKSIN